MPDLPLELWMHIAQFLSTEVVKDLYGVNQALYHLAMDEKYREVKFNCVDSDLLHKVNSLGSPDIARRVRSFHISSHLHDADDSYSFTWRTAVLEDIVQSIMNVMPNLIRVHTYGVCWQGRGSDINPPIVDAGWTHFAPNLQHLGLSIPASRLPSAIPHSFQFPNLETLYIKILVDGNHVPTADSLQALASFINQLHPRLQKLVIRSSKMLDVSALLLSLAKFEHLTLLELDNTAAPLRVSLDIDPSIQFMNKNTATIRDLTLASPLTSSLNFQYLCLRNLTSLLLDASFLSSFHFMSLAVFFKNVSHTLKSLTILGSLDQAQFGWLLSTIEATDLGPANGLRALSIGIARLTRDIVVSISNKLPHLDSLTLRIHHVDDPSTYPLIPGDGFPEPTEEHPFVVRLREVSFDQWKLRDITIKRSSCCGVLFLWGLMKLFAECIPGVKSFSGNGDMTIPNPPNFQRPTKAISTCRDIVCSYGNAGMVTSREFPLRNSLLYRP